MGRLLLIFVLGAILGCSSSAKDGASPADGSSGADNSGKMTLPADDVDALRLGVSVKVTGLPKEAGLGVAKAFEEQLPRFEPCLKAGKAEIVKLTADWDIGKDGLLNKITVVRVIPENKIFQDCVVKQLKLLEFKGVSTGSGQVSLGTYWGRKGDWQPKDGGSEKRFEKLKGSVPTSGK